MPNPAVRERLGIVTTFVDDVMNAYCFLPEVFLLPPPNNKSGEDEAPTKMPTFSYYDQIWVYSELEAFKSGFFKGDFVVISNLQRLDIIFALEKPEPIQLSLQNQIMTSENEDSTNSDDSDTNSHVTPRGDKVTRSFLPHGVSSKAQLTYMISSINHPGAHIIGLDAVVKPCSRQC